MPLLSLAVSLPAVHSALSAESQSSITILHICQLRRGCVYSIRLRSYRADPVDILSGTVSGCRPRVFWPLNRLLCVARVVDRVYV